MVRRAAPRGSDTARTPPRLVAVFAHPDDETFLAGGTLATYAGRGWDVRLVCATRGEAGKRGPYASLSMAAFAAVRAAELAAACDALGIGPPRFLECPDGGVTACAASAEAAVLDLFRELEPQVIVTFGPDGVSGHADHVSVHALVTSAFEAWRRNGAAPPHLVSGIDDTRLYYVLRSAAVPACCRPRGPAPPPPLTTAIDIAAAGHRKLAAVQCHRSQRHLHPADDLEVRRILTSPEQFHRAVPGWSDPTMPVETDLRPAIPAPTA